MMSLYVSITSDRCTSWDQNKNKLIKKGETHRIVIFTSRVKQIQLPTLMLYTTINIP